MGKSDAFVLIEEEKKEYEQLKKDIEEKTIVIVHPEGKFGSPSCQKKMNSYADMNQHASTLAIRKGSLGSKHRLLVNYLLQDYHSKEHKIQPKKSSPMLMDKSSQKVFEKNKLLQLPESIPALSLETEKYVSEGVLTRVYVYKSGQSRTKSLFACKVVNLKDPTIKYARKCFEISSNINSAYILKPVRSFEKEDYEYFIMEGCCSVREELHLWDNRNVHVDFPQILRDHLRGIKCLHNQRFCH